MRRVPASIPPPNDKPVFAKRPDGSKVVVIYIRRKTYIPDFEEPIEELEELIDGEIYLKEGYYQFTESDGYFDEIIIGTTISEWFDEKYEI